MILHGFFVGQVPVRFVYRGGRLLYDRLDKKLALRPELQALGLDALGGLSGAASRPVQAEEAVAAFSGEGTLGALPGAGARAAQPVSLQTDGALYVKSTSHFLARPLTEVCPQALGQVSPSAACEQQQTIPVLLTAQGQSPAAAPASSGMVEDISTVGDARANPPGPAAGECGFGFAGSPLGRALPGAVMAGDGAGELQPRAALSGAASSAAEILEPVSIQAVAVLFCQDTAWQLPELAEGTLEIHQVYDAVPSGSTILIS